MTTIKTPNELSSITNLENTDLITVWDGDEVSSEKMKKMGVNFMSGFKNKFINPNFNIWQRETNQGAGVVGYGSDDKWSNSTNGSSSVHSRQLHTLGQTDVPGEPKYYSRTVVSKSTGAGNFARKLQRIEGVGTFAGETKTLSFYAKADTSINIATEVVQNFGTGGSPSAQVTALGVTTHALTTSWQKFVTTVTLPSISGKTLGTNDDDYLQVAFWFDAGSDYNARTNSLGQQDGTFELSKIQVESGSVATAFEERPEPLELLLCNRYYRKSYDLDVVPGTGATPNGLVVYSSNGHTSADHTIWFPVSFQDKMRADPSVTVYDAAGNSGKATMAAGDNITASVSKVSQSGFYISATNGAASTTRKMLFYYTADAEL